MNQQARISTVVPFSLKGAPAFIETQMPVGRVSAEAHKERKAGSGQTLTAVGSYWKGRKPLILVRACILGCLLPATSDPLADLRIFLMLMGLDDEAFTRRIKSISPKDIGRDWHRYSELVDDSGKQPTWRADLTRESRHPLVAEWLCSLPYDDRLGFCLRPEEMNEHELLGGVWDAVNGQLGTSARSVAELVEQLGIMRYGRRARLADTFCGGGSIPFEATRLGCDVAASDLNPVACMLTWGAVNIVGATEDAQLLIEREQERIATAVDAEMARLGVEHDEEGNRAKSFLYCLETRCPKTGWMVPVSNSWVVSKSQRVVARMVPDHAAKRYDLEIVADVDDATLLSAEAGTVQGGRLVHPMNPDRNGVSVGVIRGDYREAGVNKNRLRPWTKGDIEPRPDDVWQERLYCIQWVTKETIGAGRQKTFFSSARASDLEREARTTRIVADHLSRWQESGLIPDMAIATGKENEGPIRTNGWTHWHHMFVPRQLLLMSVIAETSGPSPLGSLILAKCCDYSNKSCQWRPRGAYVEQLFSGPSLKTQFDWGARASLSILETIRTKFANHALHGRINIVNRPAGDVTTDADLYVTDPPYADSVRYEEITEFFIAWLRKRVPNEFATWTWDSQRDLAIKGADEKFRSDMVAAYASMTKHMSPDGMQVVMFTHQDVGVWADLAAILWSAGLRVSAAWNIVTETASALKEGNYVQGTVLLVLRKRQGAGNAKRMDIEGEIEDAVDHQLRALNDLSHDWTTERLYTDGDLQLAAYAAALRVITNYETIDRVQVGADVYRKLRKGERTVIRDLIDYAASVANNKLVPDGFPTTLWRDLDKTSRFYIRMLDMESKGSTKFADYQDFAKTFSVNDYTDLMADTKANQASLAGAATLRGGGLTGEFGKQPLRRVLFATYKVMQKGEPKDGLNFLKLEYGPDYWPVRAKLIEFARYLSAKTARTRPDESAAADLLMQKLEVDRL